MADGLTFEQLQQMGAKPGVSFEELQARGARPSAGTPAPTNLRPRSESMSDEELGLDQTPFGREMQLEALPPTVRSPQASEEVRQHRINENNPLAEDWLGQGIVSSLAGGAAGKLIGAGAKAGGLSAAMGRTAALTGEGATANKVAGGDPAVGGFLGAVLGKLGLLGNAVLNSKGATARQFIEDRGGDVGLATPGRGAVFNDMSVEGNSAADIGEQARASGEKVQAGLDQYKDKVATQPYLALKSQIPEEVANRESVPMSETIDDLQTNVRERQDPAQRAALQSQLDTIDATATPEMRPMEGTTQKAEGLKALIADAKDPTSRAHLQALLDKETASIGPAQGPVRPRMYTEAQANELRQVMGRQAGIGESTAAQLSPLKRQYRDLKEKVDQGPYGPANEAFSSGMRDYEDSLRLLDLKKNKKPGPNEANINKLRVKGQRSGENTVTAGSERARKDAFTEKHPDLGLELERPELLRRQADLSFRSGVPQHGNLYERLADLSIPASLILAAGGGHLGRTAAALGTGLVLKNAAPLAGRVLYNPARAASAAAESSLLPPLLFQAARLRGDE